ncbi:MAG: VOC family protein [Candidatus Dojkabacteria bacterium]
MKITRIDSFMIWTEDYRKLADWYMEMFGLAQEEEISLPDDTGVTLKVGDGSVLFWIGNHSGVKGKSKDPFRIMIGFQVDDVYKAHEELSKKGVEFISKPKVSPTGDYDVVTAKDPEGNIIQLFHDHD